jgi:hypothetical protein
MIIRVLTDNQYRLADEFAPEIDRLDAELLGALDTGDEAAFGSALQRLIGFVRERGALVPHDELVPSDAIVPAPDMGVAETRGLLQKAEIRMPTE